MEKIIVSVKSKVDGKDVIPPFVASVESANDIVDVYCVNDNIVVFDKIVERSVFRAPESAK